MNPDERKMVAVEAAYHLQSVIEDMREVAREIEEQTGHKILSPERKPVSDATRTDLENARNALSEMLNAVDAALRWVGPNQTLGRVLKVMPSDAAKELTDALVRAGLMSGD